MTKINLIIATVVMSVATIALAVRKGLSFIKIKRPYYKRRDLIQLK